MPRYPGDNLSVRFTPVATHEVDGYGATGVLLGTHSGTHLDAPRHFLAQGRTVDQVNLSRVCGRARVLDVRSEPETEITPSRLEQACGGTGQPAPGELVLLWTGWDKHFGTPFMTRFPFLGMEAAHLLVDWGVSLVGTDTLSVDSFRAKRFVVHDVLLGADRLIVENLCHLDRLEPGTVNCCLLPLPFSGLDGSPVRAIAWR
ncbi:MAG: cyclase family protein [Gaiellales bacterium]|nr:cyclase family protein [Gaiellales bacterium]